MMMKNDNDSRREVEDACREESRTSRKDKLMTSTPEKRSEQSSPKDSYLI